MHRPRLSIWRDWLVSYHVIYNSYLRDRVIKVSEMSHYNMTNVLSVHALIGAYKPEGREWVDELCQVLGSNVDYAYDYITRKFKGVSLAKPQGTYMLYLDCEELVQGAWKDDGRAASGRCARRCDLAGMGVRLTVLMRSVSIWLFPMQELWMRWTGWINTCLTEAWKMFFRQALQGSVRLKNDFCQTFRQVCTLICADSMERLFIFDCFRERSHPAACAERYLRIAFSVWCGGRWKG